MADQTADEIKKANIAKMGEVLGAQFSELRQELIRTYVRWAEFIDLFGSKKETVDLLNRAASLHFRISQDVLWESLILHIARLIDPPKTGGQPNLTVKNLPALISDAGLRSRVDDAVAVALKACEFSLNWRHKIFAHNDLDVALKNPAKAVPTADRQQVDAALKALADVLNALEAHYHEGAQTAFNLAIRNNGATTLLSVLDSGIKAREEEIKRLKSEIHAADFLVQPVAASKKKVSDRSKLKARLPRGLADRGPAEIAATRHMVEAIRVVFERYGFEPLETPAIEYTDALGKFLPDQDRPNEGVFSFQDDDEQWLSLRYDLTAPLARYVAENFQNLALPHRSYRYGWVFRNEKPGPGRFRQFMQFDADTVGAPTMAADAEMCMLAADTMEALGIPRGSYVVKVNNRKVLDGVMEAIGLGGDENAGRRLTVLRAIDKLDRLSRGGVGALLGEGRKDESGDFTKGAGLADKQIADLLDFLSPKFPLDLEVTKDGRIIHEQSEEAEQIPDEQIVGKRGSNLSTITTLRPLFDNSAFQTGLDELEAIAKLTAACKYQQRQICIDPSVVRGLEYYTGPVYEVELLIETKDDKGRPVRFGSVGGGGRYDGLVSRFRGEPVPATGFSIGVSRLQAALTALGKLPNKPEPGPVVVTVFDKDRIADYQKMAASLRAADIRAELYLGNPKNNLGTQLKYADKRGSPCAVIQGGDEKKLGLVQIKDLIAGAEIAATEDRADYLKKQADAQFAVKEDELVEAVRNLLARHKIESA